jgi:hypothetical protein
MRVSVIFNGGDSGTRTRHLTAIPTVSLMGFTYPK